MPTTVKKTVTYRKTKRSGKRYRRERGKMKLFRAPKPGGRSLVVPLKCAYRYVVAGTGTASVPIDQDVGLQYMINPDWYNRYSPIFSWIKINKVHISVVCPYNIGQQGVGGNSLYKMWSKKADTTAETPPTNELEWMNLQNSKKSIFRGKDNSVNYYFTPAFEAPQGATIAKRLMYKRWFEMPTGPTGAVPHIGIIAHLFKVDGSTISNAEKFNVNVTLYCQVKGIKQL